MGLPTMVEELKQTNKPQVIMAEGWETHCVGSQPHQ